MNAAPLDGPPPHAPEPPEAPEASAGGAACSGAEVFALQVLGSSMEPEFMEGEILVIEPQGALHDGCYVLAELASGWIFRQLVRAAGGGWCLQALNPAFARIPLESLAPIRGVVVQKSVPGQRQLSRRYA